MKKIKEQMEDWKSKVLGAYEQTERLAQEIEELDDNLEAIGWSIVDEEEDADGILTEGESDKYNKWTGPVGARREPLVPEEKREPVVPEEKRDTDMFPKLG
eukprot:12027561-Heterocapsa_arctica.AAC.1